MAINFPDSPYLNQVYSYGEVSWQWNGTAWDNISSSLGPQGVQGTQGTQGLQGIQGLQGTTPTIAYVFSQDVSSNVWNITHNLNFYPNVTIIDSAGTVVEGEIDYTSVNTMTLTFSATFSGKAYLS